MRLKDWGDQQRQAAVNIANSLFTEVGPAPTAHAGSPNNHRLVSECESEAPLMGEYYVRRSNQRTVARYISIFR